MASVLGINKLSEFKENICPHYNFHKSIFLYQIYSLFIYLLIYLFIYFYICLLQAVSVGNHSNKTIANPSVLHETR
jgi:hypothetical protein